MMAKVIANGLICGPHTYLHSGWNVMDGSLVIISIIDLLTMHRGSVTHTASVESDATTRIFSMLRVFRLLRTLRPLRGKQIIFQWIQCSTVSFILFSHKSSTGVETCCSNITFIIETNRTYRRHLLYILHHFRNSRCTSNSTIDSQKKIPM